MWYNVRGCNEPVAAGQTLYQRISVLAFNAEIRAHKIIMSEGHGTMQGVYDA